MLSYHNDPAIKVKYEARFAAHRAADEVIQGTGFDNGRGCFVGCTLDSYDHKRFPIDLGWPEWLAHLADTIFEGIPASEAPQFGTDLLAAVPVGVDLEPVRNRFLVNVQRRNLARLGGNYEPYVDEVRRVIEQVISLLDASAAESAAWSAARSAAALAAWSVGATPWSASWLAARLAARSARSAESAARSAESAAQSAESAQSAAESAARSAARSADSAAESAARWAARSAEFQTQRDDLLTILRGVTP